MSSQDLYHLTNTQQLAEIANWQQMNNAFHKSAAADASKLLEEVIELCYQSGMHEADVMNIVQDETLKATARGEASGAANIRGIADEYGDVLTCLIVFRNKLALHSVDCITRTLEKIRGRSWQADKDGILRRPR